MGSIITHLSILCLYYLFPDNLGLLGLMIGALIPETEYIYFFAKQLVREKKIMKAFLHTPQGFFHTLLGSIVFNIPVSVIIVYLLSGILGLGFDLAIVAISSSIGVLSHLLLDIPGHREFIFFYPYVIKDNPFIFKKRFRAFERFYPLKKSESYPFQYIGEYNWWVFSHIFVVLAIIVVYLK
jgi:hypothetical protein